MDKQKLQILLDAQTELNYKDFCEYLEIPIKTGNSKIKQLKEIDSICKREMTSPTKFKIVEIYNNPLNIKDNRRIDFNCFNISKELEYCGGIYKIQLDNTIYIGQTNNFRHRFRQHKSQNYIFGTPSKTKELIENGGIMSIIELEDDELKRLEKETTWTNYYILNDYNVINNTNVLYKNKNNQRQKSIKVNIDDYEKVLKLLKDNNISYM